MRYRGAIDDQYGYDASLAEPRHTWLVDAIDAVWEKGIAAEWHEDLADTRQDIYSPTDGEPADEAG